jgi:hypothetical protein
MLLLLPPPMNELSPLEKLIVQPTIYEKIILVELFLPAITAE